LTIFIYTCNPFWIPNLSYVEVKTLRLISQFILIDVSFLRLFFARPHLSVGLFFVLSRNSIIESKCWVANIGVFLMIIRVSYLNSPSKAEITKVKCTHPRKPNNLSLLILSAFINKPLINESTNIAQLTQHFNFEGSQSPFCPNQPSSSLPSQYRIRTDKIFIN